MKLKKDILEIIAEVKAIKKVDFHYPTEPVKNTKNILGVMSHFELQLFTAIRNINLEHEKVHAKGDHSKKDNASCILYNVREQLLTSILMDSIAQKLKSSKMFMIDFKQGGVIEVVDQTLDPEEDLTFIEQSDFEKDQPGFLHPPVGEA